MFYYFSNFLFDAQNNAILIAWINVLQDKVEQAIIGTKNVMTAAAEANVRRVVFTSSIGTVYMNPNRSPDTVVDESCWSDLEFCKNTKVIDSIIIKLVSL